MDGWAGPGDEDFWVDLEAEDLADAARAPGFGLESVLEAAAEVRWSDDAMSPDYAHLDPGPGIGAIFQLLPEDLELLAGLNDFPVSEAGATPVLFGLRGCAIIADHSGSAREVTLRDQRPDHESPRCVLGVWDRSQGRLMVFPGSTVPNATAVRQFATGGKAGNLLPTGLYRYVVGPHATLRQDGTLNSRPGCFLLRKSSGEKRVVVVRRSVDDLVYTTGDHHERSAPGDNIHPTFSLQPTTFSSFGCQTVVGMADSGGNHRGPWADFRKAAGLVDADGDPGRVYLYMLLTGAEARLASELRRAGLARDPVSRLGLRRLRFGARGEAVRRLQTGLGITSADGDLGPGTAAVLYDRQRTLSPPGRADGILTPISACRTTPTPQRADRCIVGWHWRLAWPWSSAGTDL
jgi:endonuclease G